MKIIRSYGVSAIATYLSLMRQDSVPLTSPDDRPNNIHNALEDEADPASESHISKGS